MCKSHNSSVAHAYRRGAIKPPPKRTAVSVIQALSNVLGGNTLSLSATSSDQEHKETCDIDCKEEETLCVCDVDVCFVAKYSREDGETDGCPPPRRRSEPSITTGRDSPGPPDLKTHDSPTAERRSLSRRADPVPPGGSRTT